MEKVHPYIAYWVEEAGIKTKKAFGQNISYIYTVVSSEDFDPSEYEGDEALDCNGKVVKLSDNVDRWDLMNERECLETFIVELQKTDPDNFFSDGGCC